MEILEFMGAIKYHKIYPKSLNFKLSNFNFLVKDFFIKDLQNLNRIRQKKIKKMLYKKYNNMYIVTFRRPPPINFMMRMNANQQVLNRFL